MAQMPDLASALHRMLPEGVALGQGDLSARPSLWPGEDLPGALPKRLVEFSAGRYAARAAITALGHSPAAIPAGLDRAPIWPAGLTGSISHCAGACFAIATESKYYQGLGIDLEPATPLAADLWPSILRPEEAAVLQGLSPQQQPLRALQIFSAKEAAYKAQYAISRQLFDFQTLQITLQDQSFIAEFCAPAPPFSVGFRVEGRCQIAAGFCAALAWIATV